MSGLVATKQNINSASLVKSSHCCDKLWQKHSRKLGKCVMLLRYFLTERKNISKNMTHQIRQTNQDISGLDVLVNVADFVNGLQSFSHV